MNHSNPFVAGPTLQNPDLFVGREQELRAIVSRMGGSQPTSLNIVGSHQIGKSSLLYYFFLTWEQRISQPQNYVVIYLSLKNANCQKENNFYQAIAQELLSCPSVQIQPKLVALLQKTPLDRVAFSLAIKEFKRQGLLPVLCLDDFESLFVNRREFDNGFYDNLRSLMDDSALMLVIASCKELDVHAKEQRLVSSFFNVGHVIKLEELTTDEAIKLTRLSVNSQSKKPALTEQEQNLVQQWGKRHPYFIQLAGYYLYEARQTGKDIEWAKRQFKNQVSKYSSELKLSRLHSLPKWLWKLINFIGICANFVENSAKSVIGMVIILAVILVVFKAIKLDEFIEIFKTVLGIK
ncbi:MAG: AAA-like domain-containing protein [Rivularia sp. (in: cyanobacteria)]